MLRENNQYVSGENKNQISRRGFLAGAGAAALSFAVMDSRLAHGTEENSKINIGLIGCGGRGKWIVDLFAKHGGYNIVAAADYFEDRVNAIGEKFNIPASKRYTGLSCYKKMLNDRPDAIVIESPPYFHPEQAAAGVDAGVHVYLAKPIAVDVSGCNTVSEAGKKATAKKLCFLVDFQTRANEFYCEALKRVHNGDIGKLAFGEATYHADNPWKGMVDVLAKDPTNPEYRLRAWGLDKNLSGDIITEQNIHTIDVMSWIMDQTPLRAFGKGGRTVRTDAGDIWDHFVVTFEYPENIAFAFSSRQFNGHGTVPEGIRNRMFGSKGVLETEYGGTVLIRGENFYRGGQTSDIYEEGVVSNIQTFHKNITAGDFSNPTVEACVRSNLITILGRTAAYETRLVSWDEIIKSNQKSEASLKGLKD
ncbi:MAG: Gfo/Idh/MocA family oxidoreductase [Sedimentisphaerales bacterium]|jgi:predicted dehydrogenase